MATKTDGTQLDASEWTVYVSDRTHARLAARKTKALRTMDAVIASLLDGAELQLSRNLEGT